MVDRLLINIQWTLNRLNDPKTVEWWKTNACKPMEVGEIRGKESDSVQSSFVR
jgi:hypothetical protein